MSETSFEYVGRLEGHKEAVTALTCGVDSQGKPLLVSGSRDKKVIIWSLNLENPQEIDETKETKDYFVGKPFKSLTGHNHFVSSLDLSSDSKYLVSGSWDKTARVWDLNTFKTTTILKGHEKDILAVRFTPDDRGVLTGSIDKTFRKWDLTGKETLKVDGHSGWVSSINVVNRGDKNYFFAVGSWDQSVKFYDKNLNLKYSMDDHDYGVNSLAVSEDGDYLFSAEKNGKIRVVKVEDDHGEVKSTIDLGKDLNAVAFHPNSYIAISCATSSGLVINEVNKSNKALFAPKFVGGACQSLCWDQSGTYLFAGFADGTIRVIRYKFEETK